VQELFLKHIDQNKLFKPDQRILLAISGGLDSMVMLDLFIAAGFHFGVVHCNFQLRGSESDDDEQFVRERCKHGKIQFYAKRFETNNYATTNGLSIQMAARELRYAWFHELLVKERYDFISTAHHLNDSVETLLLNLINGRGLDGLTGIAVKNNHIVRPLLFATREQIKEYASDKVIIWREDSSNQHDDYKRNFIRHQITPRLKELNPALEESLSRTIRKNEGTLELEQLGVEQFESHNVNRQGVRIEIQKEPFTKLTRPASVLYTVIKSHGFLLEQCDQIIASLHAQPGKRFLSSTHQLVIDRNELIITLQTHVGEKVLIDENQRDVLMEPWALQIEITRDLSLNGTNPQQASLDADKINFPIVWRPWKEGDFFYPLGMEHKKKVSDLLIDLKVPVSDKATVTVLECNGEIIWVAGYRISNHFKITPETKRAIRFHLTRQI
jgi:tRNA(Ile)-lysidine synthase